MMKNTKTHMVVTALELFFKRGYGAVGTAELCRAAGINKGTFYHYFASKAALLVAVINHYADELAVSFETVARSSLSNAEKLTALFEVPERANLEWRDLHGFAQGCLVGNMTLELGSTEPEVRAAALNALARWKLAIRPILAECRESQGRTKPSDYQLDSDENRIMSLLQGGLLLAKAYDAPAHISAMAPIALAMMATTEA